MNIITEGQRVLHDEANAINLLADNLGEPFKKAVTSLLDCKGRIALTGMGKSGHVARKIAATMASTGSPAYFIHPAEASHGDLGMVSPQDAVIAISNSGNTAELRDIVLYAVQNNMILIGITKNSDSFLAKNCTILLQQPQLHEACPLDCAPTTSTTLQLALGDAIAMALLRARGFTKEEFNKYHPGGALGKKLQKIRDVMLTGDKVPTVREDDYIHDVLFAMTKCRMGAAPIVDASNTLLGVITDGDIRRNARDGFGKMRVKEVMSRTPLTISPDDVISKAKAIFAKEKVFQLCVAENGKLIGMVTMHEV